jgi:hypothetical protein
MAVETVALLANPSRPDSFKLVTDECGQTTISAFPALKFACRRDAERFCARVTQSRQYTTPNTQRA